uniref:glutathione transferase n=1 Tax=Pundamilia nyererei TaxID=303518 RepID=A0A3B4FAM5_9CICH
MPMTLAYWDIRGLAQPIRLLLEYTGEEYEDKYYVCGEAPNYDKTCWTDVKNKLGLDFPNLPYLLDGDRKITQSNAIMRYIARKHNMCGETEGEKVRVDIIENQSMDFRNGFVRLCYTNFDEMKPDYLKMLPNTLKQFSDFLGDRKWFAGDKALEKIAAYMKSPRFMKAPINNKMAKFGNK